MQPYGFAISPRDPREFCLECHATRNRGRRECRAPMRPQPRVQIKKHTRVVTTGHTGFTRHSLRNGFNGFLRALPGDRALFATVACRDASANLTPASGRQDHTTSPSASAPFVKGAARVHRIPSRVRDDREPPLYGTGPNRCIPVSTKSSTKTSENPKSILVPSDPPDRCDIDLLACEIV